MLKINEEYFDKTNTTKNNIANEEERHPSFFGLCVMTNNGQENSNTNFRRYIKDFFRLVNKLTKVMKTSSFVEEYGEWQVLFSVDYGDDDSDDERYDRWMLSLTDPSFERNMSHYLTDQFMYDVDFRLMCPIRYSTDMQFKEYLSFLKYTYSLMVDYMDGWDYGDDFKECTDITLMLFDPRNKTYAPFYIGGIGSLENIKASYEHETGRVCDDSTESYTFKYNGGVHLSDNATKKAWEFKSGDILYSTLDGQLTDVSDGNVPIAICVNPSPRTHEAFFISINYMSQTNPEMGSMKPIKMTWGNRKQNMLTTRDDSYYRSGEKIASMICQAMTENKITDDSATWYGQSPLSIPIACASLYRTIGTKSGDWFVPKGRDQRVDSMCVLNCRDNYEKFSAICQARRDICGEQYVSTNYWTCSEVSEDNACAYFIGSNDSPIKAEMGASKYESFPVIAYLKVS